MGKNIKPAVGKLFSGEEIDVICGLSTGGLFHLQASFCVASGDLNCDGTWNVLDIVTLANCILANSCPSLECGCAADLNGDGNYNVLDIVILANCILSVNCG